MYGTAKGFTAWAKSQGLSNKDESGEIEVLSCNWETVVWFMACGNQWDHHPDTGQIIKLPLTEIRAAADLLSIKKKEWRERFIGLTEMINETLKVIREK